MERSPGEATGSRFNARAVGGAGDWIVVGPDGLGRIDVRLQFKTEDNAHVYVQYFGLLELNEVAAQALAAGTAPNTRTSTSGQLRVSGRATRDIRG